MNTLPPEWKTLVAKKEEARSALRSIEQEMEAYASVILLESFKKGKWKVGSNCYSPGLVPAYGDKEAEDALEEILSVALKMGYHDRFTITGIGQTEIHGQVNDGDLSLSFHVGMKPNPKATEENLKQLHLDFDITDFARDHYENAIDFAERDLDAAQSLVENLKKALAALPPEVGT